MTRRGKGPLSRIVNVEHLLRERGDVTVTATPEECAALAADFGLVALRDLVGRFHVKGTPALLKVSGAVEAYVTQTCTVSLDPFETALSEPVDVDFSDLDIPDTDLAPGAESEMIDAPDPIVNGRIDLGTLTAEFLALGLDPFPRKPGVAFEQPGTGTEETPFAVLRRLRDDDA